MPWGGLWWFERERERRRERTQQHGNWDNKVCRFLSLFVAFCRFLKIALFAQYKNKLRSVDCANGVVQDPALPLVGFAVAVMLCEKSDKYLRRSFFSLNANVKYHWKIQVLGVNRTSSKFSKMIIMIFKSNNDAVSLRRKYDRSKFLPLFGRSSRGVMWAWNDFRRKYARVLWMLWKRLNDHEQLRHVLKVNARDDLREAWRIHCMALQWKWNPATVTSTPCTSTDTHTHTGNTHTHVQAHSLLSSDFCKHSLLCLQKWQALYLIEYLLRNGDVQFVHDCRERRVQHTLHVYMQYRVQFSDIYCGYLWRVKKHATKSMSPSQALWWHCCTNHTHHTCTTIPLFFDAVTCTHNCCGDASRCVISYESL